VASRSGSGAFDPVGRPALVIAFDSYGETDSE
jgi:hypothetical protein